MYIGCINSVVNHNFTLTIAHLLLQCLHRLICTTDYLRHTSGNPMAVAYSYCYKFLVLMNQVMPDIPNW